MSEELDRAPIGGFDKHGKIALDAGDMGEFHSAANVVASPED